ncbi:MAG: TetR/AcrR family transcriptional regulator [Cytophagales bacterium]|nr:MAG: TetR/AcrR family transcriptional regulator [Cytophagales bacterium]
MEIANKITKAYIEYMLENDKKPTVYGLCKKLKIKEEEYYEHFNSIADIEAAIWLGFFQDTQQKIEAQEVYSNYSVREKMLSFYFTWLETLKAHRSFILQTYQIPQNFWETPNFQVFDAFKQPFIEFTENLLLEGRESEEVAERPLLNDYYSTWLWKQALQIFHFWLKDTTKGFEKTDLMVEKSVNFFFDFAGKGILDSAFDYLKFSFQNSKLF